MTAEVAILPREFRLVAACCIWPPFERRNLAIRDALDDQIDWDRVLRIAKRQRVAGLVHDGLTQVEIAVPSAFAKEFRRLAAEIARRNLQHVAESLRIQKLFDESGIPLLFVKGITLAQIAYGRCTVKQDRDIDLLVLPDDVPMAFHLLADAGYHAYPPLPPMKDGRYKRWIKYACEYELVHSLNSIHVDCHWRATDNNLFLPGISAISPSQTVAFANGVGIRTLADEDLFTYLCVHGAQHGWSRLKWIADVAAFISHDTDADLRRRLDRARLVGAADCVAQAFLLCDKLFGIPSLAELSLELRRNFRNRWLERVALGAMTNGNAVTELGSVPFGNVPILMSHFLLGRGWRFAANELWFKMNRPYDQLYGSLPGWLSFLYPFVRVAAWVKRRGRLRPLPTPPKAAQE